MADVTEFDPVDALAAGALGEPGQRTFLIQARKGRALLSVLVEKEQVALLVVEATEFLDHLADEFPEAPTEVEGPAERGPIHEDEPRFRARLIGLGYDPERGLVLLELREQGVEEGEQPLAPEESEGQVARLYATREQVRAMVVGGTEAVSAGRPTCPLCDLPMDPAGHGCPRWN